VDSFLDRRVPVRIVGLGVLELLTDVEVFSSILLVSPPSPA
jgi:hypothetical protein